ncbi:MAG: isopentenyl phosphate kinase [Desulfurococcaceae archaeon]
MSTAGESLRPVYVKLGGSLVTVKGKPVSINYKALESIAYILRKASDSGVRLIVGNGGGSFAHYVVLKHGSIGYRDLTVLCQRSTRILNHIIVDFLLENGIKATSVQTSAIVYYDNSTRSLRVCAEPVKQFLVNDIVPVVYGECIIGAGNVIVVSTERIFELLAREISPRRIVLLTDVNGVYTCDPKKCKDASLIKRITRDTFEEVLLLLKQGAMDDATGSMFGKVQVAGKLAFELGVEVVITSGLNTKSALEAITGGYPEEATLIAP